MTYDSFEMHRYDRANYGVTLIDSRTGARFVTNSVVCGRQATAVATRYGKRPMSFVGCSQMVAGEVVPCTDLAADCTISDPLHSHVHRFPVPTVD